MKFTDKQLEAVAELVRTREPRFMLFMEALGDFGEALVSRLIFEEDQGRVEVTRGMARVVTDILKSVSSAPSDFERAKEKI